MTIVVRLAFPARAEYLLLGRLAVTGLSRVRAIDDETLADLKLAVTEACGNVVKHAYGDDGGTIDLRLALDGDRLEVVVEDDGLGLPNGWQTGWRKGELVESGMGLAIIEAIADDVTLGPRSPGGTVLRLEKHLAGTA